MTSAGICEGFAGTGVNTGVIIFAGFVGLVAGTLAMGAVECSKLRAERDQQAAQLGGQLGGIVPISYFIFGRKPEAAKRAQGT